MKYGILDGMGLLEKKRPPLKLPFKCEMTRDFRIVSLEPDGVLCVPVLGMSDYKGPRARAPEHTHPECIEISYCLRGELSFACQGREYPFRSGSVFVTQPKEPHRLLTPDKGLRMYWMFFRVPRRGFPLLRLAPSEAEWLKGRLLNLPSRLFPATKRVHAAFKRLFFLYDRVPKRTPERRLQLRAAVTELLLALVEASAETPDRPSAGRVEALIEEMRAKPGADYPIDALAERAALSPSNLALRFKALVGLPPHTFLVRCRIARAKELLAESDAKVTAVAQALGFPSAQHFATQFRNVTGRTPRAWRQAARQPAADKMV